MLNVKSEAYLKEISNRFSFNRSVDNLYASDYLFLKSFIVELIDYRRYLYKKINDNINLLAEFYSILFYNNIEDIEDTKSNIREIKLSAYPISSLLSIQFNILSYYDK